MTRTLVRKMALQRRIKTTAPRTRWKHKYLKRNDRVTLEVHTGFYTETGMRTASSPALRRGWLAAAGQDTRKTTSHTHHTMRRIHVSHFMISILSSAALRSTRARLWKMRCARAFDGVLTILRSTISDACQDLQLRSSYINIWSACRASRCREKSEAGRQDWKQLDTLVMLGHRQRFGDFWSIDGSRVHHAGAFSDATGMEKKNVIFIAGEMAQIS